MLVRITLIWFFLLHSANIAAQGPVVRLEGIVNAASLDKGGSVTAGEIVSIFGERLASEAKGATTATLPYSLVGTSVTVNGVPAPLFYVSPNQINLQMPSFLNVLGINEPSGPLSVVITSALGSSSVLKVPFFRRSPGVFTQNASGCGAGSILNEDPKGGVSLNSTSNSASPGSYISVYWTGLGAAYSPPPDGVPAPDSPLAYGLEAVGAEFGLPGFLRVIAFDTFVGRAPGLIGVDQVNFKLPDDVPEGCHVPLTLFDYGLPSQSVTLSIRKNGGACQNASPSQIGFLHWERTVTSSTASALPIVAEQFTGELLEAPGNLLQQPPAEQDERRVELRPDPKPRTCSIPGVRALDAGQLTVTANGKSATVVPDLSARQAYQASLPAGSVQAGLVEVRASGGTDLGAFRATMQLPPPIVITTSLQPGTAFSRRQPLQVKWTGGDASMLVVMSLAELAGTDNPSGAASSAFGNAGQVTLPVLRNGYPGDVALLPSLLVNDNVTMIITVKPADGTASSFSAPGLVSGQHDWRYRYVFKGLRITE